MVQPINRSPLGFGTQTKKPSRWFWGPNHQIVAVGFESQTGKPSTTSFEVKSGETFTTDFDAKPKKTVATDFEVKPGETTLVVLSANH
jgi:hypothetical protein